MPNHEFKSGDIVILRSGMDDPSKFRFGYTEDMELLVGRPIELSSGIREYNPNRGTTALIGFVVEDGDAKWSWDINFIDEYDPDKQSPEMDFDSIFD